MDDRKAWLTEDFYDLPEGSCIYVMDEGTGSDGNLMLDGMWSSMAGSYFVTVPASICTFEDPDTTMKEAIKKFLASDEFKHSDAYKYLQEQKKKKKHG
jgi:hypothetical protein